MSSNSQIVERMYECFNRADLETIRQEIFASDLIWRLPGHHPLAGIKNGADEVIAFFNQLNQGGIEVRPVNIADWGDSTVVEVHKGQGENEGAVLDTLNCTHYQIRDGKIAEVQVYVSDQHALDNFFSAAYQLKPIPERMA